MARIGVWLVGARGSVATATVAGAAALSAGLAPPTGLVTALPAFAGLGLPDVSDFVFGGHDVADVSIAKRAEALAATGVLPAWLPAAVAGALEAADVEVRPGVGAGEREPPLHAVGAGQGEPPLHAVRRVQADLEAFRRTHALSGLVVVHCATTEPAPPPDPAHDDLGALRRALAAGRPVLPASSLYAYAALDAGWPFVDFTPSTGARLPALDALARARGAPHAGSDGKTGETLVKSALAAMFADRHLAVRSWTGTNVLGGGDGAALADPGRAEAKRRTKSLALQAILGVRGEVHIVHVPHLGDWKTAWDLVDFEGFLGTRMRLQFTWEGADSALAAPLVLDLARLVRAAHAAGRAGPLGPLAFFFKDPVGTGQHRLDRQWAALTSWAASLRR